MVYNTNGYDTVETIQALNGYVDVYLPDLKYYDEDVGLQLSKAPHYFVTASQAIQEMVRQVGSPQYDEKGMLVKGVIVRHLALPGHILQTKKILQWVKEQFGNQVVVSVMAQYFPTYHAKEDPLLGRKLTQHEYQRVLELVENLEQGYVQELGTHEEEYVPEFDGRGVLPDQTRKE